MKMKERAGLTPVQLRKKAAEFARNTVAKQSESFRRYGVMGDFEKPYLTLQPEYEAAQIEVGWGHAVCVSVKATQRELSQPDNYMLAALTLKKTT